MEVLQVEHLLLFYLKQGHQSELATKSNLTHPQIFKTITGKKEHQTWDLMMRPCLTSSINYAIPH